MRVVLAAYFCLVLGMQGMSQEITWADFKAPVPDTATVTGAEITTGIGATLYGGPGRYRFKVYAFVYQQESWVRVKSQECLKHETVHWQIAKLAAALCQKLLNEGFCNAKEPPDVQYYIEQASSAANEMNRDFDGESGGSVNREKEKWWERHVALLLYEATGARQE